MNNKKKVYLRTYGCQMNLHDSERLLSLLAEINYDRCDRGEDADLILFNTCAIRDHANSKFYSHLGEIKRIKLANPQLLVGVGGCIGELEGAKLLAKFKYLDFVFSPDTLEKIPQIISTFEKKERSSAPVLLSNQCSLQEKFSFKDTKIVNKGPRAFVAIMKGCNNFCSYCVVPYTRGRERSRPLMEVFDDVLRLVEVEGVQEVTLLGQNVNSYSPDDVNNTHNVCDVRDVRNVQVFVDLLRKLEEIDGLRIIRYTTSHPRDMSDELIQWHGSSNKLSKHLHLPVQSGSNNILAKMNRGYTIEHYLRLLEKLRTYQKEIVISSDMICGYPNETEDEHISNLTLLDLAQFDFIYSYAFSPRPGTAAALIVDHLSDEIRSQRLRELQLKQLAIQEKIRSKMVGKKYLVLVDGVDKRQQKLKGRTNCMRIVHFTPETEIPFGGASQLQRYLWKWVEVEVSSSTAISAQAHLLS
ncbi:MAG: tRNA (N6-isopentenyl adenosine(37)-C2)-methylthiotransferase MiaB [Oligoflexia bacterium]|nr:tRNA (N6-isopentenyl adenosine(37)-C2)-methylthiotransferase MiaB [Oligoflexia bacterium]